MSSCPTVAASASLAEALKILDCQTGAATSLAFGRLFGADGRLLPALTILLTLYVALFAIGLLTGRTRIGVAAFTPRMMTLGLVLTFATSWVAYQNVVWTLAVGAPDQLASIVSGTKGSATAAFADRLDTLFVSVADSAERASKPAPPTETGITPATPMVGGFTASTVLWLSALMLLLGSVGVLVTAKIALAAILALGPVFIVMALFPATRGLFEGWLKAIVLLAVVPLFAVLIGGGAIAALEPVARAIDLSGEEPSTRAVGTLFLGSAVFVALMVMAVKTGTTLIAGWRLPGTAAREREADRAAADRHISSQSHTSTVEGQGSETIVVRGDERVRGIVAAVTPPAETGGYGAPGNGYRPRSSAQIIPIAPYQQSSSTREDPRAGEVGRRFRPALDNTAKEKIS